MIYQYYEISCMYLYNDSQVRKDIQFRWEIVAISNTNSNKDYILNFVQMITSVKFKSVYSKSSSWSGQLFLVRKLHLTLIVGSSFTMSSYLIVGPSITLSSCPYCWIQSYHELQHQSLHVPQFLRSLPPHHAFSSFYASYVCKIRWGYSTFFPHFLSLWNLN